MAESCFGWPLEGVMGEIGVGGLASCVGKPVVLVEAVDVNY